MTRNNDTRTFVEKAGDQEAWGLPLPDWIKLLATAADEQGLKGAAAAIGYSTSLVSTTISGKYPGDMAGVEARVRGAFAAETVECPVLSTIGRERCLQEQTEPLRATSAQRAILFHACRSGCPHYRKGGADGR